MCTKPGIGMEEFGVKIRVQDVSPIAFSCKVLFIREGLYFDSSKSTTTKNMRSFTH